MDQVKLSKQQENKFSTFEEIETVLNSNSQFIDTIPEFVISKAEFSTIVSGIRNKAIKKNTVIAGVSAAKSIKREELESVTRELSSVLFIYGKKNNNTIIKAIADIKQSDLMRMRDTELLNRASSLLETIEGLPSGLDAYGKKSTDIDALRNCITNYHNSSTEKTNSSVEKYSINFTLKDMFKKGMDILDSEIDKFVNSFKKSNPEFYTSYYSVRSIKNLGVRHKQAPDNQNVQK